MSDALYERYKDALRRGHVGVLRRRYEAALVAYAQAAALAPDRAIPQASLANVLDKLGRREEALAAYDRALERAPRHEPALLGRAEVLVALGRRVDAAEALTLVADMHEAEGHWVDACEAARRALEMAESKDRRRHLEGLATRLRYLRGDDVAAAVLARAMPLLEGGRPVATPEDVMPGAAGSSAVWSATGTPEMPSVATPAASGVGHEPLSPAVGDDSRGAEPAAAAPAPEDDAFEATPPELGPIESAVEAPGDGFALTAVAEGLLDEGDLLGAHDRFLAAAAAHRAAGRAQAALDAYYVVLALAPADGELHLALAELYLEHGWRALAVDKLQLLGRLAQLDANAATIEQICTLVAERLPNEPRLADLCLPDGAVAPA